MGGVIFQICIHSGNV
ncbi:hypothetical protein E2C01_072801 [Portunus trituberculatus]|uniref:Uncharacterized protein n=1 Tax=Portunus trituberculatus TaxID=210409 RepID=A0A5B7I9X3_PORTR|nr:hypothetical protein [Portunus trituberculatus]